MAVWTVINQTELSGTDTELVDVTSIPSSYDHLYVAISARGDYASGPVVSFTVQFNGDSGTTNYDYVNYYAQSTTVSIERNAVQPTVAAYPRMPAATSTTGTFSNFSMWVPNYANTSNFKTVLIDNASENDSASTNAWYLYYIAGMWSSTNAVNQITINTSDGTNFVQYSTFTLYGVTNDA